MTAVQITSTDRFVRATVARPASGNAVDDDVLEGLSLAMDRATTSSSVRALVLCGMAGVFCAGADIDHAGGMLAAGRFDEVERFLNRAADVVDRLTALPMPVIAAVDGPAFAGGLELVLASDIVIATPRARFADRHAVHGFVPGWGSTVRAPERLGPATAARLLLTGEILDAAALPQLVAAIVEPSELDAAIETIVDRIAGCGRESVAAIKRLLRHGPFPLDEALARERQTLAAHLRSDELRAGVDAFIARSER